MDERLPIDSPGSEQSPGWIDLTQAEGNTSQAGADQEVADLRAELAAATQERDEAKTQLQAMRLLVGELGHKLTLAVLDIQEKERVQKFLAELVATDPLTGLPNRTAFENELERRDLHQEKFAIAIIDLTNFKAINDHYGHKTGDEVIKSSGDLVVSAVLAHKTRGHDYVAHISGDEFAVIFDMEPREETKLDPTARLAAIREHLLETINKYGQLAELDQFGFDASIGIAIHDPAESVDGTYREADRRMFEHKAEQRRQFGRYRS
jgi:diguanylate cyclase (GGDEF)-like protein